MGKYLVTASYTADGAKGLLKDGGTRRLQVVRELLKGAGATLDAGYFALGDEDVFLIVDAPDHASVTAIALLCGFSNLGHFASAYRTRFGELPSQTLHRSRFRG